MLRSHALLLLALLCAPAATAGGGTTVKVKSTSSGGTYSHMFWVKPRGKLASSSRGTLTLSETTTGQTIEQLALGQPFNGTVVASGDVGAAELGDTVVVALSGSEALSGAEISIDLRDGKGDGANADGWKARAILNPQGTLTVTVKSEDRAWDGVALTGVSVTGEDAEPLALSVTSNAQILAGSSTADLSGYASVTATARLYDADGEIIETTEQVFTPEGSTGAPSFPPLRFSSLTVAPKSGAAQLTTWSVSDGTPGSLEVELVDAETGKSALMTVDDSPVLTRQIFAGAPVVFDGDEDASGYTYLVLVDLLDESGAPTGAQQEVALVLPDYDAKTDTAHFQSTPFKDRSGGIGFIHHSRGYSAYAWTDTDEEIHAVDLTFEEPFEGPPPLESTLSVAPMLALHKWTQVGTVAEPKSWRLDTTLLDAEGATLETSALSSSDGVDDGDDDTPTVYYHNRRDGQEEKYMEIVCTDGRYDGSVSSSSSSDTDSTCETPWIPWSCQ